MKDWTINFMRTSPFKEKIEKACKKKVTLFKESFWRYALRATLAGAFLTMSTAVGIYAADKIAHVHPDLQKFMFAFIFAFGLVYILFLNAELATSNMMYLSAGLYYKAIDWKKAGKILLTCTLFNLLGCAILGWLFNQAVAFQDIHPDSYMVTSIATKVGKTTGGLFFEAILANLFVNTAILSYLVMKDQTAKIIIVLSAIFMFVFLGNEHVIANFASMMIAAFNGFKEIDGFTVAGVLRNWIIAFLGNCVGGGICIGLAYAWLNDTDTIYKED